MHEEKQSTSPVKRSWLLATDQTSSEASYSLGLMHEHCASVGVALVYEDSAELKGGFDDERVRNG